MRTSLLVALLPLAGVLAQSEGENQSKAWSVLDWSKRLDEAHHHLFLQGPSHDVLDSYDQLVSEIEKQPGLATGSTIAQLYFRRAIVELTLNRVNLAVADLMQTMNYDPQFTPAKTQLKELWSSRGAFKEIKEFFDPADYADIAKNIDLAEQAFGEAYNALKSDDQAVIDNAIQLVDTVILPFAKESVAALEVKLQLLNKKAEAAFQKGEAFDVSELLLTYGSIIKLQPRCDLATYSRYSQLLMFFGLRFVEARLVVKGCLRIDNDYAPCGSFSKFLSRMQPILEQLEEYSNLDEYIYSANGAEILNEKLALEFDYGAIYAKLAGPLQIAKRERNQLPSNINTVYKYLKHQTGELKHTFGVNPAKVPFTQTLAKFACESSVRAGKTDRSMCKDVDESSGMFLPKHYDLIKSLLQKKKYAQAKGQLQKFQGNVRKTAMFQELQRPLEEYEQMQQQQQHQRHFEQQRQRQEHFRRQQHQQQQRQQQTQFDRAKDYYKILDISPDADERSVKKAYRTQTLKYHPDKYKGGEMSESEMEAKMQEINEAYEILSDAAARADYDRGRQGGQGGLGGSQHQQAYDTGFDFNPGDFMAQFMRQGGGGHSFQFSF